MPEPWVFSQSPLSSHSVLLICFLSISRFRPLHPYGHCSSPVLHGSTLPIDTVFFTNLPALVHPTQNSLNNFFNVYFKMLLPCLKSYLPVATFLPTTFVASLPQVTIFSTHPSFENNELLSGFLKQLGPQGVSPRYSCLLK